MLGLYGETDITYSIRCFFSCNSIYPLLLLLLLLLLCGKELNWALFPKFFYVLLKGSSGVTISSLGALILPSICVRLDVIYLGLLHVGKRNKNVKGKINSRESSSSKCIISNDTTTHTRSQQTPNQSPLHSCRLLPSALPQYHAIHTQIASHPSHPSTPCRSPSPLPITHPYHLTSPQKPPYQTSRPYSKRTAYHSSTKTPPHHP